MNVYKSNKFSNNSQFQLARYKSWSRTVNQTMKKLIESMQKLGEGSNGTVFHNLQSDIVYKIFKKNTYSGYGMDPCILRETAFGLADKHSNIMRFSQTDYVDGHAIAKMRYVKYNLSKDLPKSQQVMMYLVQQLIAGLSWIHNNGFMHRDIKPSNILFDQNNHLFITDFGLTRSFNYKQIPSPCVGTGHYRAPEIMNCLNYDYKVDVYALGVTILQIVLRKQLDQWSQQKGKEKRALKIITKSDYSPSNKERLIQIVKDCFHFNPVKRPDLLTLK